MFIKNKYGNICCKILAILLLIMYFVNKTYGQNDTIYVIISSTKQEEKTNYKNTNNDNIFKILKADYLSDTEHRKEKKECYLAYAKMFFQAMYGQITAPVVYIAYYLFRKPITERLETLYLQKGLTNIDNVGKDLLNGKIDKQDIREALGQIYYRLWLYGDTDDPILTGGVPKDYKPNLPIFIRRWLYCGVRNPRWNATYINFYSDSIVETRTVFDNRQDVITHNYGTGDTKLGTWLRWYVDKQGKWWFFYENTKQTKEHEGKLFYFGAVGLSNIEDGIMKNNTKKSRFEFSLNRVVKID